MSKYLVGITFGILVITCVTPLAFPSEARADGYSQGGQPQIMQAKKGKKAKRKRKFQRTFDKFCAHADLPSLNALERLYARIGDLQGALRQIIDINNLLAINPDQCLADIGVEIGAPSFPDISSCLDFDWSFTGCALEFNPGEIQASIACMQGAFKGIQFGIDVDYSKIQQCLQFQPPSFEQVLSVLADIDADLRALLRLLDDFSVGFNPELIADMKSLLKFCGQDVPLP